MTPHTARERTQLVTQAVVGWLSKRRYSCHTEIAILPWGKRRVDILALNLQRELIAIEVKQCWADFRQDSKCNDYLEYANRFYFAFPFDVWERYEDRIRAEVDACAGIIILARNGLTEVVKNCRYREIPSVNKRDVITRLAWRGGTSRRNTRRYKVFLNV